MQLKLTYILGSGFGIGLLLMLLRKQSRAKMPIKDKSSFEKQCEGLRDSFEDVWTSRQFTKELTICRCMHNKSHSYFNVYFHHGNSLNEYQLSVAIFSIDNRILWTLYKSQPFAPITKHFADNITNNLTSQNTSKFLLAMQDTIESIEDYVITYEDSQTET